MTRHRRPLALLALACLGLAHISGCSMGYMNLHPGENSALYAHMYSDLINRYDEPYWLWVRGTISGDLNGDGKVEQEVVIATIQKGTPRHPGHIEMALLLVCEKDADGQRQAVARTVIFDRNPVPGAPRPANDIGRADETSLTRVRAQMIQEKKSLKESVIVYFYGDDLPGNVWYAGYTLDGDELRKNLETVMWQDTPGVLATNLDKSLEASDFGYQLLFSVDTVPRDIVRRIDPDAKSPLWGHVFARDAEGVYRQADWRFGEHYKKLENSWNQLYLKAALLEFPARDLAWFEYHMALMNRYTGNAEMSRRLIEKARKGAEDPPLVDAIARFPESAAGSE